MKKIKIFYSLALTLMSFALMSASVLTNAKGKHLTPVPEGFDQLLVFMGTGIVDPNNLEPFPGVTCAGLFCDGDFFNKEIMNRSEEEFAEITVQGKAFFLNRFGIDVDDPAVQERITFTYITLNPDIEYREYIASGTRSAAEGWLVRDGAFTLTVTDPNGLELGGEFAGTSVPAGTNFYFGNYNILETNRAGRPTKETIIFFQSAEPALPLLTGGGWNLRV